MSFFILWLFNIRTPFSRMFSCTFPEGEFGQVLDGDPAVPPTVVETWPAWANAIRNAFLALFVWRTYSVIDLGAENTLGAVNTLGAFIVFGDGTVLPRAIMTRFIIVRRRHEDCRVIVVTPLGKEIEYTVVGRGDQHAAIDAAYAVVRKELEDRGLGDDDLGRALNEINPPELYTFV